MYNGFKHIKGNNTTNNKRPQETFGDIKKKICQQHLLIYNLLLEGKKGKRKKLQ